MYIKDLTYFRMNPEGRKDPMGLLF